MKNSSGAVLFFLGFVLQASAFQLFAVKGIGPNLLLCLTIFLVLLSGEQLGTIVISVVFFLLYDISVSQYMGASAAAGLCVGLSVYFISKYINLEKIISIIVLVSMETLLYNFIIWIYAYLWGSGYSFLYVLKLMPFYLLYNAFVSVLLYLMLMKNIKSRC